MRYWHHGRVTLVRIHELRFHQRPPGQNRGWAANRMLRLAGSNPSCCGRTARRDHRVQDLSSRSCRTECSVLPQEPSTPPPGQGRRRRTAIRQRQRTNHDRTVERNNNCWLPGKGFLVASHPRGPCAYAEGAARGLERCSGCYGDLVQGLAVVFDWPALQIGTSSAELAMNDGMWYGTGVIEVICV